MNIVTIGLNHRTAPIEIREKISFPVQTIRDALVRLVSSSYVNEGVIISTCNRVEIVAVVNDIDKGIWDVKRFLSGYHNVPLDRVNDHLYVYTAETSVKHLFKVSAGLDSMVMGEPQILGQVKDAYSYALQHKAAGVIINKLFHKAFSTAKRIRTETRIGSSAVSISYAAVELARKIFGALESKIVMLIGAGEMAELAAKHLLSNGVRKIIVANRTYERAVDMARDFMGTPIMFREFVHYLKDIDIVITSTAAPRFIIRPDQIKEVMRTRKNRSMFFIDISVPRNIDPLVNSIGNVYLYDIDDLSGVVEANLKERTKEAESAEIIVDEGIGEFYRWVKSLDVVPTIISLKNRLEEVRAAEFNKALSSIRNIEDKDLKVLEAMTIAIINKVLHTPVMHLKSGANEVDGDLYIEVVRRLFDLEEDMDLSRKVEKG